MVKVVSGMVVLRLITSQGILSKVETPPALTPNTVLVELATFGPIAGVGGVRGIRETTMSKLALPLHGAVHEEDEDHESNGTKRSHHTNDGVLTRLAVIADSRGRATRTNTISGDGATVGVGYGKEGITRLDAVGEVASDALGGAGVEFRLLDFDVRRKVVNEIRRNVAEPNGAELILVLGAIVASREEDLKTQSLDVTLIDVEGRGDEDRDETKNLRRCESISDNEWPIELLIKEDADESETNEVGGGVYGLVARNDLVWNASRERGDGESRGSRRYWEEGRIDGCCGLIGVGQRNVVGGGGG